MLNTLTEIQADIDKIGRIEGVNTILEVVCRTTGMGFSVVARVTDNQWVACAVRDEIAFGLGPGGELKLETTLCHEVKLNNQPVVIDHVDRDELYASHHTPKMYGLKSYIAYPIVLKGGYIFGTLCAIDPNPAELDNAKVRGMFKLFAELIAFHLDTQDQLEVSQARLLEERQNAELREQFIAILGHDLRNPVSAILNMAQLLLRMPVDERVTRMATIIQDSSYRIKALIENILDFARGRMGEGLILAKTPCADLAVVLGRIVTEMESIWPDRLINSHFVLPGAVNCDVKRIEQLFSNLLSNGLSHGSSDAPVSVAAYIDSGEFALSVANKGKKISDAAMQRLFQPFVRGEGTGKQEGLGLGLYIAAEIARAHDGSIEVESTEENTCFTFRMPF